MVFSHHIKDVEDNSQKNIMITKTQVEVVLDINSSDAQKNLCSSFVVPLNKKDSWKFNLMHTIWQYNKCMSSIPHLK